MVDYSAIKNLINSPAYNYLPEATKKSLGMIVKLNPDKFTDYKQVKAEPTALEQTTSTAQKKGLQANLMGLLDNKAYDSLVKHGIAPEMRDKTIAGRLGSIASFPLQKVMSILNTVPRGGSSFVREYLNRGLEDDNKMTLSDLRNFGGALGEGVKGAFNTPGAKYKNEYYADALKDIVPKLGESYGFDTTGFTKDFDFAQDQDDWVKGTNWIQKALSAVAGSPADITGLALDIGLDPLTYLTGGAVKGFKLADIGFDVATKGGKTLIPKGSTVVFKKAGREAMEEATEGIVKKLSKSSLYKKELANITKQAGKKGPKEAIDIFKDKRIAEEFIKQTDWTDDLVKKYLDVGGLKWAGQTVIPGHKLSKTFGKSMEKVGEIPFLRPINKLLNPYYGVPEAFRPSVSYGQASFRKIYADRTKEYMDIVGGLGKKELKTLEQYMPIIRDITKKSAPLRKAKFGLKGAKQPVGQLLPDTAGVKSYGETVKGLSSEMDRLTKMLDDLNIPKGGKVEQAAESLKNMFSKWADEEIDAGLQFKRRPDYYPALAKEARGNIRETTPLGAVEEWFQKSQTTDILKMLDSGKVPEGIMDVLKRRASAGAHGIARREELNLIKQFGSMKKAKGLSRVVDHNGKLIPELKGWYLPTEMTETFKRTYKTFFGDEAFKEVLKHTDKLLTIWKRWALATPGYHFRNFYSDMFSGMMEYGPGFIAPHKIQRAINALRNQTVKAGGKNVTPDDLLKAGVSQAGQTVTEATPGIGGRLQKFTPAELSLKGGSKRESLGRIMGALEEMDKGANLVDASFNMKKVFFDYNALTPFEQNVMKRFIPFYTWSRKNIARQFELLFTRTGRYAGIPKGLNYLEEVAQTRFGDEQFAEFKQNQPDYYKDLAVTLTGIKNKEGQPLALNPNLPFQDFSRMSGKDVITSMAPGFKIPIEMFTNRDLFFETTIDRAREGQGNYSEAPKWLSTIASPLPNSVLKYMGIEKSGDKVFMTDLTKYIMRQIPPLYTASRVAPATTTPKTGLDALSVFGGIKFFNFDIEKEKKKKLNKFIKDVDIELGKMRQMGQDVPYLNELETGMRNQYYEQVGQKYNIEEIMRLQELLQMSGQGNQQIEQVLQMQKEPYYEERSKASGADLLELYRLLQSVGGIK